MHTHPFNSPDLAEKLSLMLAYGATEVHQMAGSAELLYKQTANTLFPTTDAPGVAVDAGCTSQFRP